ncbi:hypothetical protein M5E88_00045 [Akkermansia muciniphila]|nr:hypothetical protein M5E88_00045 [Akkermansia muciniphila]
MSGLEEIPEDAAGFMIIGSKYDLSPQEAEVLQRYWARPNAAILIMLEPQNDTPKQLYRFLREQGLRPQNDRVMLRNRGSRSVFEINSIFAPSLNCTREFWNSSTGLEGRASPSFWIPTMRPWNRSALRHTPSWSQRRIITEKPNTTSSLPSSTQGKIIRAL